MPTPVRAALLACCALALAACSLGPKRPAPKATGPSAAAAPAAAAPAPPANLEAIPDAVPRAEARSLHGNPPFYDVLGQRYFVLAGAEGYSERGVASWYGPTFHGGNTSSGELYDMYGMTAAHKTLPLPTYARVTNLRNGTAMVEVRTVDSRESQHEVGPATLTAATIANAVTAPAVAAAPDAPTPAPPVAPAPANQTLYVQAGAFADPANAERLLLKLRARSFGNVFIRETTVTGRRLFRVRIGPVPDVAEFDRVVAALESAGVHDAHLALD